MRKLILIFCCLFAALVDAETFNEAINAREQALQKLKRFNPSTVLKGYTTSPAESSLKPDEGINSLSAQGFNALNNNPMAKDLFNQAQHRVKVHANHKSDDMRYAEQLLEGADEVLEGGCYQEKAHCERQTATKICEDWYPLVTHHCGRHLSVSLQQQTHNVVRRFLILDPFLYFSLSDCEPLNPFCSLMNLWRSNSKCEALQVRVFNEDSKEVTVIKQPNCHDLTLLIGPVPLSRFDGKTLHIVITETTSNDEWVNDDCSLLEKDVLQHQCRAGVMQCTKVNETHVINGLPITRVCFAEQKTYTCQGKLQSTCQPVLEEGCSQVNSQCTEMQENRCLRFSQTFQCLMKSCTPQKTICPGKIPCRNGDCDTSNSETSDDMAEGLSRLGALVGVAGEVSALQIGSNVPAIFSGKVKECKKYPLGFRDCCKDSGWGEWVKHCPPDLQELQRAKRENRIVYLGDYKNHSIGARHYVYCIFPTQLAAILQIQGRGQQLKLSFGTAEHPDCRGLTPEELERVDFSSLNLSPLEQELIARMALPADSLADSHNQSHIERLNREGRAHD